MRVLNCLFGIVFADYMERIRRYGFFFIIGFALFISANIGSGNLVMRWGIYRGLFNSPALGATAAVITTTLLCWLGFFFVRGMLNFDKDTAIIDIISATKIKKYHYIIGKWLGNFSVLVSMLVIIFIFTIPVQFICGESKELLLFKLFAPFCLIALPAMLVVSALAVLFETVPFLSRSLGNVIYFLLITLYTGFSRKLGDLLGFNIYWNSVESAVARLVPGNRGGGPYFQPFYKGDLVKIDWQGIEWTGEILLNRLFWVGFAILIVFSAVIIFHFFEQDAGSEKKSEKSGLLQWLLYPTLRIFHKKDDFKKESSHLTKLDEPVIKFRVVEQLLNEAGLLLKGYSFWWYLIMVILVALSFVLPLDIVKSYILPLCWVWPLTIWSKIGTKEVKFNTAQLISSSPFSKYSYWIVYGVGVLITMAAGSGVLVRLLFELELLSLIGWLAGVIFIPALALCLGVFSRFNRLFEGLYLLIWYYGAFEGITFLDFMGVSSKAISQGVPYYYLLIAIIMIVIATLYKRKSVV